MEKEKDTEFAIEIENLDWQVGSKSVLRNIRLKIPKGHLVGIIGPNGSGKTTLLRSISAWYKPEKKVVFIDEKDITLFNNRELSKKLAFMRNNTNIEFQFRVLDIVLMGRFSHISRFASESKKDIEMVEKAMKATGVLDLKDRLISTLSSGELQRVFIARALAQDTDILLMDEPISNLDINHQVRIMDLIKSYQRDRGLTVLVVLHDLNMAAQYCHKLILLDKGEIHSVGSPGDVLTKENIKNVYNMDVHIINNLTNKLSFIMPISWSFSQKEKN